LQSPEVADHVVNAAADLVVLVDPAVLARLAVLEQFLQRLPLRPARQPADPPYLQDPRRPLCCLASMCTCSTERPRIQLPFLPLLLRADLVGSALPVAGPEHRRRPVELLLLLLRVAVDEVSNRLKDRGFAAPIRLES
jgi:hypothetical protein